MKTDNTTPGIDPSKKYEGTASPKNPSVQLIGYTVTGALLILVTALFWFYRVAP